MKLLSSKAHVIDSYKITKLCMEKGDATQEQLERAEASLIAWAIMVAQRDAGKKAASIQAKMVVDQLLDRLKMEKILSNPELKEEFLGLLIEWPRK